MSNQNFLRFIVVTSLITVVSISSFSVFYLSPSFTNLVINNAESAAVKVGRHLSKSFQDKVTSELPSGFIELASLAIADFDLMKIKVFAPDGETVYSTSEKDIGTINERDYFHNIVARGGVFTKVAKKDTKSLEDQVVSEDVVETYVPIMQAGSFVGAFEIYFNITANKKDLDALLFKSNGMLMLIAAGLLLGVLASTFIARRSFINQELAEAEREKFIVELQTALDEIQTLRGIIPICMYCHKIKADIGDWNKLETYIEKHSDADFSHGICPDCLEEQLEEVKQIKSI